MLCSTGSELRMVRSASFFTTITPGVKRQPFWSSTVFSDSPQALPLSILAIYTTAPARLPPLAFTSTISRSPVPHTALSLVMGSFFDAGTAPLKATLPVILLLPAAAPSYANATWNRKSAPTITEQRVSTMFIHFLLERTLSARLLPAAKQPLCHGQSAWIFLNIRSVL